MDLLYVRTAHRAVSVLMRKPPIGTPSPVSFRDGKAALLRFFYRHYYHTSESADSSFFLFSCIIDTGKRKEEYQLEHTFKESDLQNLDNKTLIFLLTSIKQTLDQLREDYRIQLESRDKQIEEQRKLIEDLSEQVRIASNRQFGRKTEKLDTLVDHQMIMIFNEAEITIADSSEIEQLEPDIVDVLPGTDDPGTTSKKPQSNKKKGKRKLDLAGLPTKQIDHELSEEELKKIFGDARYKRLPDDISYKLVLTPPQFSVEEHHYAKYVRNDSDDNATFASTPREPELFRGSLATPSLIAGINNTKFVNHVPIARLSTEFERNGVYLSRQLMSKWVINSADRYFRRLYERMHLELLECHVIQADETPCEVNRDGRPAGSKSYMWVWVTGKYETGPTIILYQYQKGRDSNCAIEFLKDYSGIIVCDGFSVYQSIDRKRDDLTFANCWVHARRGLAEVVKASGKDAGKNTLAYKILVQISAIFDLDKKMSDRSVEDRLQHRKLSIEPLVDALFVYLREHQGDVPPKSKTALSINYILNRERELREFLNDGAIPLDNNFCESSIRPFCVGKKNWGVIDTIKGAESSAIMFSITETAKANNLNPYWYMKYVLEEMVKHQDEKDESYLDSLLPWSDSLPEICHKPEKSVPTEAIK